MFFNIILDNSVLLLCHKHLYKKIERAYLKQSSQAILPVVSFIVRSETKAGYSVSQGSRVCFNLCAMGIAKKKKNLVVNMGRTAHKILNKMRCCIAELTENGNVTRLLPPCETS